MGDSKQKVWDKLKRPEETEEFLMKRIVLVVTSEGKFACRALQIPKMLT